MNNFYSKTPKQNDISHQFVNRSCSVLKKITSALLFSLLFLTSWGNVWGQAANYTFERTTGTYSTISGGTSHSTNSTDDAGYNFALGFNFPYLGTNYNAVRISTNGFLVLGTTAPSTTQYNPISSLALAISPFARDMAAGANHRSQVLGSAPNRVYVFQASGADRYIGSRQSSDNNNYQIRLYETSGIIEFHYGTMTCTATSGTHQVGITGAATSDYLNVTATTSWSNFQYGTANTATMTSTNTAIPAANTIYRFTPPTSSVAPTSITGTSTICNGSSTTLTTAGGSLGSDAVDLWSAGSCATHIYFNSWQKNSFISGSSATTFNYSNSGKINVTSTSGDPTIEMPSLGSFSPSTYKYVNVRFRATSVAQPGAIEIFWFNSLYTGANGNQYKNQPVSSTQNVWTTVSIDMTTPSVGNWTHSNVTGWRFDWATTSGVTMEIDFISLSDVPIVGEGSTLNVTPTSTTTYYTNKVGIQNRTACASQAVTVNPLATAGTFQYANASTQTICAGSTISCTNSTSPTNGGAGTVAVIWYCGRLNSGSPGAGGTYGNWVESASPAITGTTSSAALNTATSGGSGFALSNYNPQTDFPGYTNFVIYRRAYNSNCGPCTVSCQDQLFYLNLTPVSAAPAITGTYCSGGTTVSGTGVNGSTISVIRSGSSIGTATVSGGVWTATVSTLAGADVLTATQTESGKCVSVASATNTVQAVSTAPVINATICPGGTTVSGTGINGSTISVIRSGSSIGTATVSGGVWTATVSTVNAGDVITATQTESGKCVSAASSSVTVRPIIDWGNLQYPSTASLCGNNEQVFGRVYIAGITNPGGATANLTAELGWSSSNTNPNTWTNWTSASYNTQSGNDDEFVATLGVGLTTGTWYYAYRYSYFGCSYLYGGTAGIWSSGNSGVATVPSSQTILLSSSVGTNAQTVCKGTSITNITYAVGDGGNNAGVTGLPTGVSGSYSGGTFTISGTPSVSGTFNYLVTTSGPSNCPVSISGTITVNETLDYANLQFPDAAAICQGGSANVFGKVYEAGLTNPAGQGAGITVHCGVNATNTNPNTWSTWTAASFNAQSGNDDEYVAAIGSSLSPGTYYYAFRYSYNGCVVYGGYSGGGGGFWDGSSNISGVLTVNPTNTAGTASSSPTLCINTALTSITHTTTSATGISNAGVSGANGLPTGVSATWSSNTISITGTPSASGTFNYSIPLTGGCGSVNATGTIVVTPANTAGAASSTPSLCLNTSLTTITHSTVGATGISNAGVSGANGLPTGVSAAWSSNSISITGTPSAAGTFNYSIPLTGGCGSTNATGTITVNAIPTQASSVSSSTITSTTATISFTRGTGSNVILVAYPGASAGTTPSSVVTANTTYGSGTAVGTGFVVYNGTAGSPSVTVTGLTSSTQYTFVAYEYNSPTCYNVTTTASTTLTTGCAPPTATATITSFTSSSSTGTTVNWTNGNGSFRIVVARLNATAAVAPTTGTTYTANSVFGSGTGTAITGTGNFVVYSGTATSVAVTGLTANNTYTFIVYEGSGTCYQGGLTATMNTSTYCASSGGTASGIKGVTFNTINNLNTGLNSYTNTGLSTTVTQGVAYTLTVRVNTGGNYTNTQRAWIDWNQNGVFTDAGELYELGTAINQTNGITSTTPSITVPASAPIGITRMRIQSRYNGASTSCQTGFDGEVEDYNLNIVAPAYRSSFVSMNTGSTTWCAGETRTVTVTVRNNGTATWSNSFPVRIGLKWNTNGANWTDYHLRTDANGLAPGAIGTYSFTIKAANATAGPTYGADFGAGTNNLIFDVVKEADCWFAGNGGSCGPGNTVFTSATQTIVTNATITQTGTLAAFGACTNTASTEQTFTVSGTCLSANLVVTAPTGFEVSATTGTGFGSSVSFVPSNSVVAAQTVFVRMASQGSSPTSGNITCSSTGATTSNVAISGSVSSKPVMGTVSVNGDNTAGLVTVCPGQTITIAQSGFNNFGGTTYFYSDNTTGLGGWAVAPDWEIINNGVITTANQVAGQNNVNNLSSFSYKINSPGTYIIHTNANNGSCYGDGFNRYITVSTPSGDQTAYGNESWIGYVYQSATAGAFTTYQGYVTESETFNRTHTTPTGATNIHCSQDQDLFTIRYKMTKSFSAGYYTFTVGGDDGVRLSIDGGSTFLINNWVDQGYTTTTSSSVYLNGSTNLVFEYYENSGGAQSSFSYTCGAPLAPSAISGPTSSCPLATSLTYSVTNLPGMTYNWTLPSGWSGTSTTNSISVTAGYAAGSISVTAQGACAAGASSSLAISLTGPTNVTAGSNVTVCYNVPTQLTGSATGLTGTATSVSESGLSVAVTDNNVTGITRTRTISNSNINASQITSVSLKINSEFNADLDIYLTSPSGFQIALAEDKGGSGSGYDCSFVTGAATLPTTNVVISGNVAPQTPFSSFTGSADGTWTLTVKDDASGDLSTLISWSINYTPFIVPTYSWSPSTGLSSSTISNPVSTLTTTTTYTMTATANGCSVPAPPITLTVRPQFTSGAIATTGETLCVGVDQANITSSTAASGGDNAITYEWRANGNVIANTNSASYDPGNATETTTYTRWAKDATCNTTFTQSTGSWVVTVGTPNTVSTLANGDFLWTGTTSSDWATTANWRQWDGSAYTVPSGFPNSTSANVFFPSVTGCVANAANLNASTVSVNNMTIESGNTFTLNNASSVLNVAGSLTNNGTWATPTTGSTVSFNGSGSQTIPTIAYSNLQTATGGTKTLAGTTNVSGVVTVGASSTLSLGANILNLSYIGTPLVITGTFTPSTGTVNYSGSGEQNVTSTSYYNLGTTGSGVKTLAGTVALTNALALTDGTLTLGANTLNINGSTITRTSGSIDASNASATLVFGNSSLLTLPASVFSSAVNNMTLNSNRVLASSDFSVNGILNLNNSNPDATNGLLDLVQSYGSYGNTNSADGTSQFNDLNSAVLTLGSSATVTGAGDVSGKVRRTSFSDGVSYAFGNKDMQLTFNQNGGASLPSQITVVSTKGNEGLHVDKDGTNDFATGDELIGGAAVRRLVQILRTGGSEEVLFTARFPYFDSELNGNTEANLVVWNHDLPYAGRTPHEQGQTDLNTTENWIETSGHGVEFLATEGNTLFTKYWMLGQKETTVPMWLGAANGSLAGAWNTPSNWSTGVVPTDVSIIIPNATKTANDPDASLLPATVSLATIEIQTGGILNGGSSEIILTGGPAANSGRNSWLNNGTFNAGTGKVTFDYTSATISGTTAFNDITVNTGKQVTILANSNNSISGAVVNDGTFDATTHTNTITYNGSGQAVIQPNGAIPGYSSLKIDQQSSGSATASGQINVSDTLIINAGTLDMATADLYVEGNFVNNSSIVNNTQVFMSGTGSQSIEGTSPTTFEILLVTGASGTTTVNQDINVNQILYVEGPKTLNGGNKIIKLIGSGQPFILDGAFDAGTGTVNYTSVDPTDILPIAYYNLKSEGAVTKTLLGSTAVSNALTLDGTLLDVDVHTLSIGTTPVTMNSGSLSVENGTLELTNASAMSIPSSLIVNSTFKDLSLTGAGAATLNEDMIITEDLVLTDGSLNLGSTMLTFESNATMSRTSGLINSGTGGLIFKAANLDASALASGNIHKLEVNRAGGTVGMNNGNLNVTNTFTLTDGTFDINANELRLSGGITHNGGDIDAAAGTVDFNNTGVYTISNGLFAGNVHGLKVSGAGGLTLSDPIKVTNALTMSGGNVTTASSSLLEIGTSASTVGSITWNAGTVVGPLRRWFAASTNSSQASGIFPVGTVAHNRFAQINFTEAPEGGYLDIEYKDGLPPDSYSNLPLAYNENNSNRFIQNADEDGYWEMKPYNTSGTLYGALDTYKYDLLLRINNPTSVQNGGILNNPPGVRLIRAKGNPDGSHEPWSMAGTYSTAIQMVEFEDYVIKSVDVEGFSWFNGGGNNQNPLPIELLSFAGNCLGNEVTLNWATASEFNNNYFVIEKSRDGVNWKTIHTEQGSGTSFQKLNYVYVEENQTEMESYYRLSQVDIDGKSEVFDPIFVGCSNETSLFKTYPNPSDASFQILVNNESLVGKATIKIVDTKGTVVSMKEVQVEEGTNLFYLNENMAPGIYYISITNGINSTEVVKHSVR